jgi:inorganic pyrophosphatase
VSFGLVLGYKSAIISILAIAASICVSFSFEAMYGITMGVLVMLSTIATESAIEIYDSISDNFGGIIDIVGMSHCIRERTNALYAVGNTNATIGNEFTIGSATLVSMAFFGVCISNASISTVDVL